MLRMAGGRMQSVTRSVECVPCGQRVAHLITSPQDVLDAQCWLSPSLSLSVGAWCQTEPHFADPGQGEGVGVRGGRGHGI